LHLEGLRGGAGALTVATSEPSQASSALLAAAGALVGPEPYQVAADLRADVNDRTTVMAANRLVLIAVAAIVIGSVLALTGVVDPASVLLGTPTE
jgi:hypothetical protein